MFKLAFLSLFLLLVNTTVSCKNNPVTNETVNSQIHNYNYPVAKLNNEWIYMKDVIDRNINESLKEMVVNYAIWKIIEDKKKELNIQHLPEELIKRAASAINSYKNEWGKEAFLKILNDSQTSEEEYIKNFSKSNKLHETFTLEKLFIYELLTQETVEIEIAELNRLLDAVQIRNEFKENSDKDLKSILTQYAIKANYYTPSRCLKGTLSIDFGITETDKLFLMGENILSDPINSKSNTIYLVRKIKHYKESKKNFSTIQPEIINEILTNPPPDELLKKYSNYLLSTNNLLINVEKER